MTGFDEKTSPEWVRLGDVEPACPGYHRPKFQAKFVGAEEEPNGPFHRLVASVNTTVLVYNPPHEDLAACYYDIADSGYIRLWTTGRFGCRRFKGRRFGRGSV